MVLSQKETAAKRVQASRWPTKAQMQARVDKFNEFLTAAKRQ